MGNLEYYEKLRKVPDVAKKKITGGRLNNMTNISPMWRIKQLTEVFGPCGIGWVPRIVSERIEDGTEGQKVAVVDIELKVKVNGEWSEPIPGTGGSMLVSKEKAGLYTSDEAFKMAYTDALSVAAKSLGLAADVYFSEDAGFTEATKYDAEDINYHNILIVKQRIEQRMTYLIKRGMDEKDILAAADTNKRVLDKALGACNWLHKFEQEIARL